MAASVGDEINKVLAVLELGKGVGGDIAAAALINVFKTALLSGEPALQAFVACGGHSTLLNIVTASDDEILSSFSNLPPSGPETFRVFALAALNAMSDVKSVCKGMCNDLRLIDGIMEAFGTGDPAKDGTFYAASILFNYTRFLPADMQRDLRSQLDAKAVEQTLMLLHEAVFLEDPAEQEENTKLTKKQRKIQKMLDEGMQEAVCLQEFCICMVISLLEVMIMATEEDGGAEGTAAQKKQLRQFALDLGVVESIKGALMLEHDPELDSEIIFSQCAVLCMVLAQDGEETNCIELLDVPEITSPVLGHMGSPNAEIRDQAKHLLVMTGYWEKLAAQQQEAEAAAPSEGNLRACAHCAEVEPTAGAFKACAKCRSAYYCNREHQKAHWKAHKKECGLGG